MIQEWFKELLIDGIISNLTGMFDTLNTKVGEIAARAKAARRLFLFFALLVAIRLYIEYMRSSYPSYIRLDLHANPLVQALNYSLGFIAGVFSSPLRR